MWERLGCVSVGLVRSVCVEQTYHSFRQRNTTHYTQLGRTPPAKHNTTQQHSLNLEHNNNTHSRSLLRDDSSLAYTLNQIQRKNLKHNNLTCEMAQIIVVLSINFELSACFSSSTSVPLISLLLNTMKIHSLLCTN